MKYARDLIVRLRAKRASAITSGSGLTEAKSVKKWPKELQNEVAIT